MKKPAPQPEEKPTPVERPRPMQVIDTPRPPVVVAKPPPNPHLERISTRVEALKKSLAAAVYVDSIEEARLIFDVLRNDAHVMRVLRADRDELEFLLRRQKDLTPKGDA